MITVKNLSYAYPKSKESVLRDLNFEIEQGEIFGFLGPSGAGNSTTQKILYKILSGFTGEVLIDGKPLRIWGNEYFEKIGVGFELPNHYLKLTARENLQLFGSFYALGKLLDIDELFETFGLADKIHPKRARPPFSGGSASPRLIRSSRLLLGSLAGCCSARPPASSARPPASSARNVWS